jgi:inosose dehydratase
MPTDPVALRAELDKRGLVMLGAFVPVALKHCIRTCGRHRERGEDLRVCLPRVAATPAPYLVLADDNGSVPDRTRLAGRVTPGAGLSAAEWKVFGAGADQLAHAVFEETGLKTVFHHHCAGYVETPDEIATLLELTNPQTLGLVFDTGHYCYGAGGGDCDVVAALERFGARVWYIHCKDCEPEVARRARGPTVGLLHSPCATESSAN